MDLYHILAFFLLYSLLGWMLEVAYHVVKQKVVVNRGFLNGPVCPIYGFGMLSVIELLVPLSDNLVLLFVGGTAFATAIELFGGWILYRLFHMRWWDYSGEKLNLGGFICLKFSLAWGVCIIGVIRLIHPIVALNVYILDNLVGYILIVLFSGLLLLDFLATVLTVVHLNQHLHRLNEMAQELHSISDAMTERIGARTMKATAIMEEVREEAQDLPALEAAIGELQHRRNELAEEMDVLREKLTRGNIAGYGRMYAAFPGLQHLKYNQELQTLLEKKRSKRKDK